MPIAAAAPPPPASGPGGCGLRTEPGGLERERGGRAAASLSARTNSGRVSRGNHRSSPTGQTGASRGSAPAMTRSAIASVVYGPFGSSPVSLTYQLGMPEVYQQDARMGYSV